MQRGLSDPNYFQLFEFGEKLATIRFAGEDVVVEKEDDSIAHALDLGNNVRHWAKSIFVAREQGG